MSKKIVVKIHNNSISKIIIVKSEEDGKDLILDLAEEQFGRSLKYHELNDLNDRLEIYNDEDPDNMYTFSINTIE
jgi:hypothetical protein